MRWGVQPGLWPVAQGPQRRCATRDCHRLIPVEDDDGRPDALCTCCGVRMVLGEWARSLGGGGAA